MSLTASAGTPLKERANSAHCRQSIWNAQNWVFLYWRQGFPLKTPFLTPRIPKMFIVRVLGGLAAKHLETQVLGSGA